MEPEEPQEPIEEIPVEDAPPAAEPAAAEPAAAAKTEASTEKPAEEVPPVGPTGEQRTWAVLAHLLGAAGTLTAFGFLGWVAPLVIWIKQRHTSPYVAFHSLQALMFHALIAALMTLVRMLLALSWLIPPLWITWVFLPLAIGAAVLLSLVAAIKANNGEWYQYPCVGGCALEHSQV